MILRRSTPSSSHAGGHVPLPGSERGAWVLAISLGTVGLGVLLAVLTGVVGVSTRPLALASPPPVLVVAQTPVPVAVSRSAAIKQSRVRHPKKRASGTALVTSPSAVQQKSDLTRFETPTGTHISARWIQGFYPIYSVAQSTFGVNWLLLASIHKQESAFSTAPSTYHGLNFAGCCGGPMQFNVTNGPVTTWQLVSNSYIYGQRPAFYDHQTTTHPSIYDDFDAVMAGAHLLSSDGAGLALDQFAWNGAYDYYGHDATGVTYADQVLARAISWSQHGFCVNCSLDQSMVAAVHGAYGAPVLASLQTPPKKAIVAISSPAKKRKR